MDRQEASLHAQNTTKIVRAIEDNTRQLGKLTKVAEKLLNSNNSELEDLDISYPWQKGQLVIHRQDLEKVNYTSCSHLVLLDPFMLTISTDENVINCPTCKKIK